MDENDTNPTVVKGKIVDKMGAINEYSTGTLARKVGLSREEIEPYLEELAEEGRIRKRDGGERTKWVRFR
jgi:predicted transcriptional regulator